MQLDSNDMPVNIRALPRDERGVPIPWFVHTHKGVPDFRVIGRGKVERAVAGQRCFMCGERLDDRLAAHQVRRRPAGNLGLWIKDRLPGSVAFIIAPVDVIERVSRNPPSHHDCALYAAQHCPVLGSACVVWHCVAFGTVAQKGDALLPVRFELGEPYEIQWYREGRRATRDEATAMLESAAGVLQREAQYSSAEAQRDLDIAMQVARLLYLPPISEAA